MIENKRAYLINKGDHIKRPCCNTEQNSPSESVDVKTDAVVVLDDSGAEEGAIFVRLDCGGDEEGNCVVDGADVLEGGSPLLERSVNDLLGNIPPIASALDARQPEVIGLLIGFWEASHSPAELAIMREMGMVFGALVSADASTPLP